MDSPIDPDGRPEEESPGLVERILLGATRLAALPLLALVIVLASLIYGLAILARRVAAAVAGVHCSRGPVRT